MQSQEAGLILFPDNVVNGTIKSNEEKTKLYFDVKHLSICICNLLQVYDFFIHFYSDEEEKEVIRPPQHKAKQIRKERYTK